jgi:hypothetical protein
MRVQRTTSFLSALLLGLTLLGLTLPVRAQGGLEDSLPAGFQFVAQLDVRQFVESPVLQPIRDRVLNPSAQTFINNLRQITSVDLLKDLDQILFAGYLDKEKKAEGLMLLQGRLSREGVVNFLKMSAQFKEIASGSSTIYEYWSADDNELRYAAFLKDGLLAMGRQTAVERALALSDGRLPERLSAQADYARRRAALPQNALFMLVILAPGEVPAERPEAPFVNSLKTLGVSVAIEGEQLALRSQLETSDADAATQWGQIAAGFLAAGKLYSRHPEAPGIAKRIELGVQDTLVSSSLAASAPELLTWVDQLGKLKAQQQAQVQQAQPASTPPAAQ